MAAAFRAWARALAALAAELGAAYIPLNEITEMRIKVRRRCARPGEYSQVGCSASWRRSREYHSVEKNWRETYFAVVFFFFFVFLLLLKWILKRTAREPASASVFLGLPKEEAKAQTRPTAASLLYRPENWQPAATQVPLSRSWAERASWGVIEALL